MKASWAVCTALVCLSAVPTGAVPKNAAPALWAGMTPGPYAVGYRRLDTRSGVVHSWYPTSARGAPLRFRDFLGGTSGALASFLAKAGVSAADTDSLLASRLYSIAAPRPLDRAFPLVLVAQGNGQDVADQVVLCEYLANQGYVVASTPSPMLRTPMEREDQAGTFAERQAADLAAAMRALAERQPVDTMHVGIVGHSFGARAALLLAMRDPRIRAVVSLDGGIGTASALEPFRQAPSFHADAPLPPLLHFYEKLDAFMKPEFTLLKGLHIKDLVLTPTHAMHHVHFTTYGFAAGVFPSLASATHATHATAPSARGVVEATAAFLGRNLN